jgi:death-on-curing protein
MPRRRAAEPRWVPRVVVDAMHLDQLRAHGGLAGLRDENALEAALARPRHKWAVDGEGDLATLAAAYAFAVVTAHPYRDGNKRVAFLTMVVFLGLNGFDFEAPEPEVVTLMLAAAAHRATEADLASWIRARMVPRPNAP